MSALLGDIRFALRQLIRQPLYGITIVVLMTVGVAGNAGMFRIFNGLFLRPLPFDESEQLVDLNETAPEWDLEFVSIAYPDFVGWRENNRTFQSMTVFTFLALGMAAPYVILSSFPKLIEKLPRPGAWMETFKQVMSFPMFATCIWLIWLMGAHVGNDGLIMVLGGLLVVAIGAWVYGRWSTPVKPVSTRRVSTIIAAVIAVIGIWMLMPSEEATSAVAAEEAGGPDKYGVVWEPFSPELVASARQEGRPVFIDFTAKWCLTCKANKAVVFASDEVKNRFDELGVVMVKADWTKRNPVITDALEEFGRSGVPLYVLYDGKTDTPQILPELLNPGIVLDALEGIKSPAASIASK